MGSVIVAEGYLEHLAEEENAALYEREKLEARAKAGSVHHRSRGQRRPVAGKFAIKTPESAKGANKHRDPANFPKSSSCPLAKSVNDYQHVCEL